MGSFGSTGKSKSILVGFAGALVTAVAAAAAAAARRVLQRQIHNELRIVLIKVAEESAVSPTPTYEQIDLY